MNFKSDESQCYLENVNDMNQMNFSAVKQETTFNQNEFPVQNDSLPSEDSCNSYLNSNPQVIESNPLEIKQEPDVFCDNIDITKGSYHTGSVQDESLLQEECGNLNFNEDSQLNEFNPMEIKQEADEFSDNVDITNDIHQSLCSISHPEQTTDIITPNADTVCEVSFTTNDYLLDNSYLSEQGSYKCKICDELFSERKSLLEHVLSHSNVELYKCEFCGKSFAYESYFKRHVLTHSIKNSYPCEICEKTFDQKATLTLHLLVHSGEKPHKCDVCDKSFAQKSNLTTHMRVHSGELPFKCGVCDNKYFPYLSQLEIHMHSHTAADKVYRCGICEEAFTDKSDLKWHTRTHSTMKTFKCDKCDKCFSHKSTLKSHAMVHADEKLHNCDICAKSFPDESTLRLHVDVHCEEKRFRCEVCEKSFHRKAELLRHMYIHSSEKPYKCEICEKSYVQKSVLNAHMNTHYGEKPFKCEVCEKSYFRKHGLTKHMQSHYSTADNFNNTSNQTVME